MLRSPPQAQELPELKGRAPSREICEGMECLLLCTEKSHLTCGQFIQAHATEKGWSKLPLSNLSSGTA